jgi:phosphoribosylformylglycinamidine cyclo-ligase
VAPEAEAEEIMMRLSGLKEEAFIIGEIAKSAEEGEPTVTLD